MATETKNYSYPKPEVEEFYDINQFNMAMDMIDNNMKDRQDEQESHFNNTVLHTTAEEKNVWNGIYGKSTGYTDKAIANLIGSAPETLDTLGEVAKVIQENQDIVEALNGAIGAKVSRAELEAHESNGDIHYTKNRIVDLIYPVGSIYQSSKAVSPATLFGGTWQQIKDVVLVAAGNTFLAGTAGGSASHTLSVANMPAHNHTFAGAAVTSGGRSVAPTATFTGTAVNTGNQSANHTHSIPKLSGTAASAGAHTHKIDIGKATFSNSAIGTDYGGVLQYNNSFTSDSAGAHTHSITTTANTTGNASAGHTHSTTAKGTVALANTAHTHSVTAAGTIGTTGSSAAINHMPPYKVMYVWERTA